jgi:hypothetical protein
MSEPRTELHSLVDQLSEEQIAPALAFLRARVRRVDRVRMQQADSALQLLQAKLGGARGFDEELDALRDGTSRG